MERLCVGFPKSSNSCHAQIPRGAKECLHGQFGLLFGFGEGIRNEQ